MWEDKVPLLWYPGYKAVDSYTGEELPVTGRGIVVETPKEGCYTMKYVRGIQGYAGMRIWRAGLKESK